MKKMYMKQKFKGGPFFQMLYKNKSRLVTIFEYNSL